MSIAAGRALCASCLECAIPHNINARALFDSVKKAKAYDQILCQIDFLQVILHRGVNLQCYQALKPTFPSSDLKEADTLGVVGNLTVKVFMQRLFRIGHLFQLEAFHRVCQSAVVVEHFLRGVGQFKLSLFS